MSCSVVVEKRTSVVVSRTGCKAPAVALQVQKSVAVTPPKPTHVAVTRGIPGPVGPAGPAGPAGGVDSVNGQTGNVTLVAADVGAIPAADKGAAGGVASLDGSGKVPESQLPALAITDVFAVADQAAMLALDAQRGDIAVRSDINKTFALTAAPASTLGNWLELRTPTDAVLSVAGKTGAVTLVKADVGLSNVDNTSDTAKPVSTATQAALDGKAPANTTLTDAAASSTLPATSSTPLATLLQTTRNALKWLVAQVDTHSLTAKSSPADGDEIVLADSAASWARKRFTLASLKSALSTWLQATGFTWAQNQTFSAYTDQGGGMLRRKIVTVTAGASGTSDAFAYHGLSLAKIVSFSAMLAHPSLLLNNEYESNAVYLFRTYIDGTRCILIYAGSGATEVYGRQVKFDIWYEP